jgi:hypothetical protein
MMDGPALPDLRVIQCNYAEGTKIAAEGARAYLVGTNPGNANDRVEVLVRSRGGRWVRKWEDVRRLVDFRVKTLPPEHPLYGHRDIENHGRHGYGGGRTIEEYAALVNEQREHWSSS